MEVRLIKAKMEERALFNSKVRPVLTGDESSDRRFIQQWIDSNNFEPVVLYNGSFVWSKDKIIKECKYMMKQGKISLMSDYFYEFLYLRAGSIAPYDKKDWISYYKDDAGGLCRFFRSNDYGHSIAQQPALYTDAVAIGKELLALADEYLEHAA